MGSVMDSRYWVCPKCFQQFDWEDSEELERPEHHDEATCKGK